VHIQKKKTGLAHLPSFWAHVGVKRAQASLNVEYLGTTQTHPKQLEGLNVEYLGATQYHPKQLDGQQRIPRRLRAAVNVRN
jgi:hypothetical protein